MDAKYKAYLVIFKRFALPILIGGVVLWLVNNGFSNWANIICDISLELGIGVGECGKL
jgi:hypothetical protein